MRNFATGLIVVGVLVAVASLGYYIWVWNQNALAVQVNKFLLAGRESVAISMAREAGITRKEFTWGPILVQRAAWVFGTGSVAGLLLAATGLRLQKRRAG